MPESLVSLSLMVVGATMATSLLATMAAVGLVRVLMLLNGDRHDEPHSMRSERDADVEMASAGVLQRVDDGFPRDPSCIHQRGRQRAR